MKALWLYQHSDKYSYDSFFHMDYARHVAQLARQSNNALDLRAYGPNLHQNYSDIIVCPYDEKLTFKDLKEIYKFDVIILNTKSRAFSNYSPHTGVAEGCWLPKGLFEFECPKVVIEEDYHYEKNDNWYIENGFELVIQRHYNNYLIQKRREKINTTWLPFSVNVDIFKPNPNIRKRNVIAFAGNNPISVYPNRYHATRLLEHTHLINNFGSKLRGKAYIECLQQYVAHLSCSSIYNITPAKMFEIMACGSVLFTNDNDNYGLKYLFDNNSFVTYKEDYSNVASRAKYLLNNPEFTAKIANNGLKEIHAKHTDEIRTEQLLHILEQL